MKMKGIQQLFEEVGIYLNRLQLSVQKMKEEILTEATQIFVSKKDLQSINFPSFKDMRLKLQPECIQQQFQKQLIEYQIHKLQSQLEQERQMRDQQMKKMDQKLMKVIQVSRKDMQRVFKQLIDKKVKEEIIRFSKFSQQKQERSFKDESRFLMFQSSRQNNVSVEGEKKFMESAVIVIQDQDALILKDKKKKGKQISIKRKKINKVTEEVRLLLQKQYQKFLTTKDVETLKRAVLDQNVNWMSFSHTYPIRKVLLDSRKEDTNLQKQRNSEQKDNTLQQNN